MINLILWLVVGGVIGWVASLVMRTDAQQGPVSYTHLTLPTIYSV